MKLLTVFAFVPIACITATANAKFSDKLLKPIPKKNFRTIEVDTTGTITYLMDGEGVGDIFTWTSGKIFQTADAADIETKGGDILIAESEGHCIRLSNLGPASDWNCFYTFYFKGGSLMAQGPFNAMSKTKLAVTGGTGAYRGVGGQIAVFSGPMVDENGKVDENGPYFTYHNDFRLLGL
uniref:Dirigent protein n=1 Tax=Helicotheca tamesis TaxID=374047 RepID=A0A7S2I634_9STRA|mmetsp:Transcript_6077/g.8304  ORF Transcript_6077/g.8304 Transcript_6077/m.8304 type:complete len:180 (+) Transcript_6077:54-593(+)|eukprot:CAMPEP_0185725982 /NCGR_PEP_ID=MMETSP1171-20130828/2101_1 /TAXON_ID=374046 /ORGANISM="Helicotheca tamensis, Strain CCMP826" /LENGTH=179 /DNA_ID=CAMNT_0028394243 /DNA_START=45 /DNA_END=584 /DNA_ORIENTATION=-